MDEAFLKEMKINGTLGPIWSLSGGTMHKSRTKQQVQQGSASRHQPGRPTGCGCGCRPHVSNPEAPQHMDKLLS